MQPSELRSIRRKANLKQWELAHVLDVTQACISHYERGRVKIPRDMRGRLRDAKLLPKRRRA